MKLPKYSSIPLCMIFCALAASTFAADPASKNPAPAAVPAVEQADYAEKMTEAKAAGKVAADKAKKEADAKAAAEKARMDAEIAKIKAELEIKALEIEKQEAEAKVLAEKAAAEKAK